MGVRYLVVPEGVDPPVPGDVVASADGYDLVDVGAGEDLATLDRVSPTEIRVGPTLIGVPVRVPEAYDPGWTAMTEDGRSATIRPDGPVMQVDLPPGAEIVTLRYADPWVTWSLAAGAFVWLLLGAAIAASAFRERRADSA
jgi:hypothetical protein